jgi:sucrose-6-phosphate hydrolase SacC (GH32 family)
MDTIPERFPVDNFQLVYQVAGRYVNDHCIVRDDTGFFHLFYTDGVVGMGCYDLGNEQVIGHATSRDLHSWRTEEPALISSPLLPWEERGIFAPYVIRVNEIWYMFYSSHNLAKAQYICLATSRDLYRWERYSGNPLFVPSASWAYWSEDEACSCRDPHVLPHPRFGFIMYWVADMKHPRDHSCIAASVSRDLVHWREIGPVLVRKWSFYESYTTKTESPCVIQRGDRYILFYRHGDGTKYCCSDDPLDWHGRDSSLLATCHASEIFEVDGQWWITHCSRPIDDLTHRFDRTCGLYLARLAWKGWRPVVL